MEQILSLDENQQIKKWQSQFRKIVKEAGDDFKVRFEKKKKVNKKIEEYGPNSHVLVISHSWLEKIESKFTFNFPFFLSDYTVITGAGHYTTETVAPKLLELTLKYWTEVAKLSGGKILVWQDYNRAKRSSEKNPPLPDEQQNIVESFGFKKINSVNSSERWILYPRHDLDNYFINLEEDFESHAFSLFTSVKINLKSCIEQKIGAYLSKEDKGYKNPYHYHYSFYYDGFHGAAKLTFLENGIKLEEEQISFLETATVLEDIPGIIEKLFREIYEHQKLKNLINPPRERFDMLVDMVFDKDWKTGKLKGAGEDIYSFLCSHYGNEKVEEWASESGTQFSYVRENDVYMFNYLDYIFVTKEEWFEAFHIKDNEKAYGVYVDKYLEYYMPRAQANIQQFRQRTGL